MTTVLVPCACSHWCQGVIPDVDPDTHARREPGYRLAHSATTLMQNMYANKTLPRCVRCKCPTDEEEQCPYWREAGEIMCDACAAPERGRYTRPNKPNRKRSEAERHADIVRKRRQRERQRAEREAEAAREVEAS